MFVSTKGGPRHIASFNKSFKSSRVVVNIIDLLKLFFYFVRHLRDFEKECEPSFSKNCLIHSLVLSRVQIIGSLVVVKELSMRSNSIARPLKTGLSATGKGVR